MSTATVRPRESRDLAEAATVLTAVHESDGYPVEGVKDPEAWLSPEGLLAAWVAELDGHVVGHVAINSPQPGEEVARLWREESGDDDSHIGVLARLFVAREARKASMRQTSHGSRYGLRPREAPALGAGGLDEGRSRDPPL